MHTVFVPAALAAMALAWLPAQLASASNTFRDIGCSLAVARLEPSAAVTPGTACAAIVARGSAGVDKPDTLTLLAHWQGLSDL